MPFSLDPEISSALTAFNLTTGQTSVTPVLGDVASRRDAFASLYLPVLSTNYPNQPSVTIQNHVTKSADGTEILLRWYCKSGSKSDSAVLFLHPGGLII